ncbi:MAG: AAA family ATPase [Planctomycetota bacterium]
MNMFLDNSEQGQPVRTIAFVHNKGGTGKTTSCLNIAGWLAKMEKKVLVVDLDPQGNASVGLGIDRKSSQDNSIYDVLLGQKAMEEIILETDSNVYLAPSSLNMLAVENYLAKQSNNMGILKESLADIEEHFDYILIDTPPGSTLLMSNGVVASGNIIIPLDSGVFAYEALETLKTLIINLHNELGVETNVIMIVLREYSSSFMDKRTTNSVKKLLKRFLIENNIPQVKIFTIPFSRKVYWSQMKGMPISHYAPFSDVGRGYEELAKELLCYEYECV